MLFFKPFYQFGAAGAALPPPVAAPPISGGARFWERDFRQRFRPKHKVSQVVQEVIEDIAARQASRLELDELKRLEELERELELSGIEWESRYLEALNAEREFLIDEEIGRRIRDKLRQDEEALILILSAVL